MLNRERNIGKKLEVIPSEEKKEINDETIEKGITRIIEEEKDGIEEKERGKTPPEVIEQFKKTAGDAEKNFSEGKWNTKELIGLVKGDFQKKKKELEGKIASITRPDRRAFNEGEKNKLKELDEKLRSIYAKEKDWLKRMKGSEVQEKEIAEVLGKEEGKTEKVEK